MTISIVTPSYNQASFLEEAMLSVLQQRVTSLEYAVIDGGSTDGSREIIKRHASRLAHWVSEPDGGQYAAINKGFAVTSGEIMGWLNSDDLYTPWALNTVEEIFTAFPSVEWITALAQIRWDAAGRAVRILPQPGFSTRGFFAGENLPRPGAFSTGWIQQESTFWRRSLWERAGGQVAAETRLAGDFELWARFFKLAPLYAVDTALGGFRFHGEQKTGAGHVEYLKEGEAALAHHGGKRWGALHRAARTLVHGISLRPFRSIARAAGLAFPAPLIRHDRRRGEWRIVEETI